MYSGNFELDNKIEEWLSWDQNENTRTEINAYVQAKNYPHLSKILMERISFGTAGLRGKMTAGYTAMNDLVIVQTAQGLLKYLEESEPELLRNNGIVIGYDGRHNSKRFAGLSAAIFLHKGYLVHLFSAVVPTPFVPFAVTKWKCVSGVMVTASHNPKQDNGYKVYGPNGAQIASPTDKKIQEKILQYLEPWANSWDTSIVSDSDRILDPLSGTIENYISLVTSNILDEHKVINSKTALKFTYSAMHGVGYKYIVKLFDAINLKVIPVEEQKNPDPEFPTVKFPNPEEGKSSLDLSFKTANNAGSTIILANDPDADRLAVAEKDLSTDQWRVFNGNELGALLGWWCLHCNSQSKYANEPLSDCYMMSSTVSSKILRTIANAEGINFIETLTGFKWMGNKSYDLLNQGKKVLFAFEEAIGFMCGTTVLDKDGISAAAILATLAVYLHHHNLTLSQQLEEIYNEYGYHVSNNSYFICHEPLVIKSIFERLRNFEGPNTYPKAILNNKYKITSIRDLTTGFDNSQPDNKAILPVSKSSQMITFNFNNGLVATLRTSGTEPKIKYYTEMCASATEKDRNVIQDTLNEMVDAIVLEFLQPDQNGLVAKTD